MEEYRTDNYPSDYTGPRRKRLPIEPDIIPVVQGNYGDRLGPGNSWNRPIFHSGFLTSNECEANHLVTGSSGSGKSKVTYPAIARAIMSLLGRDLVVVFDCKGDMLPFCHHLALRKNVPLYYFNATDPRADVWDIADDTGGRLDTAAEVMDILVPVPDNEMDKYWSSAAQNTAKAGVLALMLNKKDWGLHDLVNLCFADLGQWQEFVKNHSYAHRLLSKTLLETENVKARDSIIMTLTQTIQSLQVAAAQQYYATRSKWVSLKKISQTGGILVVSLNVSSKEVSVPIMRSIFKMLTKTILNYPEYPGFTTRIFIDELDFLGKTLPGLFEAITVGRSKGARFFLTVQSWFQIRDGYGEHRSRTLLDNMNFKTFLKTGSWESAEWASKQCGTYYKTTPQYSHSSGGRSVSYRRSWEPRVEPNEFLQLPKPDRERGLYAVVLSPYAKRQSNGRTYVSDVDRVYLMYLSGSQVDLIQPKKSDIPARVMVDGKYLTFPFWDPTKDIAKLAGESRGLSREAFINNCSGPIERELAGFTYDFVKNKLTTLTHQAIREHQR